MISLEIVLLPNEKEEREEKMETVLRDGTFCLEEKALITYDATVPVRQVK